MTQPVMIHITSQELEKKKLSMTSLPMEYYIHELLGAELVERYVYNNNPMTGIPPIFSLISHDVLTELVVFIVTIPQ